MLSDTSKAHLGSVSELMKRLHDRPRRHIGVFEGLLEYLGVTDDDGWHGSQPQVTDGSIFLGQVIEQFRGVQPATFNAKSPGQKRDAADNWHTGRTRGKSFSLMR